ncbi:MAG: hypothetical protein NTU58_02075 [Candidatus Nealsonbacteria bacterium]|nr:hypothetical protein [Candidatus Nealsonbacteria bacterium]
MLNETEPHKHSTLKKTPQHGEIIWEKQIPADKDKMEICPNCKKSGTLKRTSQYSEMDPLIFCTNCKYVFCASIQ